MKGRVYTSGVKSNMVYGSDATTLVAEVMLKFERTEMQMFRWMCGVSMKDKGRTSK